MERFEPGGSYRAMLRAATQPSVAMISWRTASGTGSRVVTTIAANPWPPPPESPPPPGTVSATSAGSLS